jgi:hypothetical protein
MPAFAGLDFWRKALRVDQGLPLADDASDALHNVSRRAFFRLR